MGFLRERALQRAEILVHQALDIITSQIHLDTYITRYKNTFLLQSPLESCLAVCFALESTNFTNTSFHRNVFLRMLERTVKESRREEICDLRVSTKDEFSTPFLSHSSFFLSLNMLCFVLVTATIESFHHLYFLPLRLEQNLKLFFYRLDTLTSESRVNREILVVSFSFFFYFLVEKIVSQLFYFIGFSSFLIGLITSP